jgi:tetratricopeptide (TPR) repeat protein
MDKLLDGLYGYEIVLGALGALLFIVLVPMLLRQIWRDKPYGGLLAFFVLPIAMIGFPGLKSIQFKDGVISLEKDAHDLQQEPTNAALREKVARQVAEVSSRPSSSPETKTKIAQAQFELGDHAAAEATVTQVLKEQPKLAAAVQLKDRILLDRKLQELSTKVTENPSDQQARLQLEAATSAAAKQPIASPEMLTTIAASAAAVGRTAEAAAINKKALTINPNLQRARLLQQKIDSSSK